MKKKYLFIFAIILSFACIYLIYYENLKTQPVLKEFSFNRIVVDSFNPEKSQVLITFDNPIYRTSVNVDTVHYLSENDDLYSMFNGKLIAKSKFERIGSGFFKITNKDTFVYNEAINFFKFSPLKKRIAFPLKAQAMEMQNDSILLLQGYFKNDYHLVCYNLKTNTTFNQYNLASQFSTITKEHRKKELSVAEGEFAKNSKCIYYMFFNTSNIVKYNTLNNGYTMFNTIDSTGLPTLVNKEFPYQGKTITYTTFENEEAVNSGLSVDEKYVYILSKVTKKEKCRYIDIYDADSFKYLKSIKLFKHKNGSSAFEIKVIKNYIYIEYNNENLYWKKINL